MAASATGRTDGGDDAGEAGLQAKRIVGGVVGRDGDGVRVGVVEMGMPSVAHDKSFSADGDSCSGTTSGAAGAFASRGASDSGSACGGWPARSRRAAERATRAPPRHRSGRRCRGGHLLHDGAGVDAGGEQARAVRDHLDDRHLPHQGRTHHVAAARHKCRRAVTATRAVRQVARSARSLRQSASRGD